MFRIDDFVVYGTAGVCRVADIREEKFGGNSQVYYILEPVFRKDSLIYAPVENRRTPMRSVIDEDELYSIVKDIAAAEPEWEPNDKLRTEKFKDILRSGNCREIALMVKSLYMHKLTQVERGRKLHISDTNLMKTAEELLYSEFAHILGISPEDVVQFILREAFGEM